MAGFRINYGQVMGQAGIIQNLSDDLNVEIRRLENILECMKGEWKGPASTVYTAHFTLLIENMRKTQNSMRNVSENIRNAAQKIQKEEERQAELARELAGNNMQEEKNS